MQFETCDPNLSLVVSPMSLSQIKNIARADTNCWIEKLPSNLIEIGHVIVPFIGSQFVIKLPLMR